MRADWKPLDSSGIIILSAPIFLSIELMRSPELLATTRGTPFSLAMVTARMLAERLPAMATTTMSMFFKSRARISSSTSRSAFMAVVQLPTISFNTSGSSSATSTSAPILYKFLARLMPYLPSPKTAMDLFIFPPYPTKNSAST